MRTLQLVLLILALTTFAVAVTALLLLGFPLLAVLFTLACLASTAGAVAIHYEARRQWEQHCAEALVLARWGTNNDPPFERGLDDPPAWTVIEGLIR